MKQIVSAKEIVNAILASQRRQPYDWALDLIAETSQRMYQNRSASGIITVPEAKKREFSKLIQTEEVRKALQENGFRIFETDYDNFYLCCKNK